MCDEKAHFLYCTLLLILQSMSCYELTIINHNLYLKLNRVLYDLKNWGLYM